MSQTVIDVSSRQWPFRMRRRVASDYLAAEHGVRLSANTLAKLAVVGGGPRFRLDGRFPLYERRELDSFAAARLGPLRASTSDQPKAMKAQSRSPCTGDITGGNESHSKNAAES
jgi:hypothetical protein